MTVHATKNGGSEGFLIIFDYKDAQNYSWLNLGGWGNSRHAVEQCKNGVKSTLADKEGKLTAGQEYTIRVQKEGQRVRCYLNGEQIIDTHLREYADRRIFTSANIDQQEDIFYVKLVNPHPQSHSCAPVLPERTRCSPAKPKCSQLQMAPTRTP